MTEQTKDEEIRELESRLEDSVSRTAYNHAKGIVYVLTTLLASGIMFVLPLTYATGKCTGRDEAAKAVGQALYEPVGNGGALTAMNDWRLGRTNHLRDRMYERRAQAIKAIYNAE